MTSINYSFLGHGNKTCPLLSCCRDSPVNDILTQWKEHASTGGKSQGLTQENGILLSLVPISNTSRERGKKSRRVAVTVMVLQLKALSTRAAHLAFCSKFHSASKVLFKTQTSLAVQLCMVLTNISDSLPVYDHHRSCLQH